MNKIRIGLTNNSLSPLLHDDCYISSSGALTVSGFLASADQINSNNLGSPIFVHSFSEKCAFKVKNQSLIVENAHNPNSENFSLNVEKRNKANSLFALVTVNAQSGRLTVGKGMNANSLKTYVGQLMIIADENKLREILFHSLEDYVQSVLHGEIPANYHLEAIKAQAICARTYALNPRVNHSRDFCNVCDSFLCCQCFVERASSANSPYAFATHETEQQVLTYQNQPALALFSACGGGHTENYDDCFSDLKNKAFPPQPIPYLKGISENSNFIPTSKKVDEAQLKRLWLSREPETVDCWSKNFRWLVKISKEDLESHIHNNVTKLMQEEDFAPFIVPPSSAIFGEIKSLIPQERGVGGTIIRLNIETSKGIWEIKKELVIRNLFKVPNLNLKRLASARVYFDQIGDGTGQLRYLHIYGLGSGHGVGLQQVGAEGLARLGKTHSEIIKHYYTNIQIEKA